MNVSSQKFVVPTKHLSATGWFSLCYLLAIFFGLLFWHFVA